VVRQRAAVRDGIVEAFMAKVDKDIRDSARLLVGKRRGWDAYNFLREMLPAVTPPSQKEIAQANEAIHQAARNGHAGGVKVARKRLMGLLPAVDPAGKTWKPDYKSPLNKAVFPKWGKVPVYVPKLVRHMSGAQRGIIIVIGDIVDHLGDFVVPRATLAEQIGASETVTFGALAGLRDAGIIRVKHQGKRDQGTVWSYAPVAEVNLAHATKVLRSARSLATNRVTEALKKTEPST